MSKVILFFLLFFTHSVFAANKIATVCHGCSSTDMKLKAGIVSEPGNVINVLDFTQSKICLLYTSPSPRDRQKSRMPSSA